jgi:predicted XRE-type DNA-binding protein
VEGYLSSGNVFEDLGLPDSDQLLLKAAIILRITQAIKRRKLTQVQAAKLLGIDQPAISDLVRGKGGFSSDRLFRFLNTLGNDVDIVIRKRRSQRAGRIRVFSE